MASDVPRRGQGEGSQATGMRMCEACRQNPGICEQMFPKHAWFCPYCMEEKIMEDMIVETFRRWGLLS